MKVFRSIFNNTLAPITPGPSSSNTCGPARIGLVSQYILGEIPKSVVVEYDVDGAFTTTLYGMKSDIGFINGLLGKDQNAPDFTSAYENAKQAGMAVTFAQVDDLKIGGLETARLRMTSQKGDEMTVIGESLGGGAFRIHFVDDCPVTILGTSWELLLFTDKRSPNALQAEVEQLAGGLAHLNQVDCVTGERYSLIDLKAAKPFPDSFLANLKNHPDVLRFCVIPPIHPVVYDKTRTPPFETAEGLVAYCEEHHCTPARAAVDYEIAVTGWSEAEVRNYGEALIEIMEGSREKGLQSQMQFDGIVTPKASMIRQGLRDGKLPSLGLLDDAVVSALGIMEHSNAAGKIVCVPTGGSSGIVPGLLLSTAEQMGLDHDQLFKGLMVSGIIGVLMMVDGNEFSGGAHGCQAEVGCGTAMAAAGLVQLLGGTAKQACDAASMALQSLMGLICDPVAGLVQVPCLARNMTGVAVAAVAAETVCTGFDVFLSLDEMSKAMVKTGTMIPNSLTTLCSGCCLTPTSCRVTAERADGKEHEEWKKS